MHRLGFVVALIAAGGPLGERASAAHCGASGYPADCCAPEQTCMPAVRYRICYKTVVEDQTRVCYRPVYHTAIRECRYTVCRPVFEQHVRECRYTICKPVWEEYRSEDHTS